MKYYISQESPFKGHSDAWKEMDTGMLFKYWDDYKVATDDYTALRNIYEPAVTTYNETVLTAKI